MKMNLSKMLLAALLALTIMASSSQAFVSTTPTTTRSFSVVMSTIPRPDSSSSLRLFLSQLPLDDDNNDHNSHRAVDNNNNNNNNAERRLLETAARERRLGLTQRYGHTVKGDALDPLRALIWQLFFASNYVFGALGVALMLGLTLNLLGYGYYWDWNGGGSLSSSSSSSILVIDTLDHIRQEQALVQAAQHLQQQQ